MASAEQLMQEAQFAFHNIGPGSTDEARNRARAKKYAMKVLRRYPVSPEAEQARAILAQLKVDRALTAGNARARKTPPSTALARKTKPVSKPATPEPVSVKVPEDVRTFAIQNVDSEWMDLWRLFGELPQVQKNIVWAVLVFLLFFLAFTPFLIIFIILMVVKRDALRELLHKALVSMHPDTNNKWRRRTSRRK